MSEGGGRRDRRGGLRVAASLRVSYESVDDLVVAYTENISRGGVFVRTTDLLPSGAVARIKLAFPGDTDAVETVARVTHVVGPGHGDPGMGLEFLDVGETPVADRVARYLADQGVDADLPPSPAGLSALVLVVDDDDSYREGVARIVADAGHRAVTARNGLDAIKKALEEPPDLILTDIEMPALDGWQFVRLVRARPTLAAVPIIFFAARLGDAERLHGYQLGVSDFIAKPFPDDELAMCIQRVLERARAYPRDITKSGGLRGDLSQVALGRVLSLLASERQSGVLLLVSHAELATAYLRDGAVVRVDLSDDQPERVGVERLFHLLDWVAGRFEFSIADVTDEDTIGVSIPQALLQHSRLAEDEPTDA